MFIKILCFCLCLVVNFAYATTQELQDPAFYWIQQTAVPTIQLNDGSQWRVDSEWVSRVKDWKSDDQITVSWIKNAVGEFPLLINISKGVSVAAELDRQPDENNPYALKITDIDRDNFLIRLNNGFELLAYGYALVHDLEINESVTLLSHPILEHAMAPYGLFIHGRNAVILYRPPLY